MIVADKTYEVTDPTIDSQVVELEDSGADCSSTWARRNAPRRPSKKSPSSTGSRNLYRQRVHLRLPTS